MFTLIENVDLYAPEPRGVCSVLVCGETIAATGELDGAALARAGVELTTIDGSRAVAIPGLIDPHIHLIGGSGEEGFASQTPEMHASELAQAGITTVVGVLGVDTTTRTMPALLGRTKAINGSGLTARLWTGGYGFPHATLTGSVRDDVILIEEIIGAGEIAIADRRSMEPSPHELARLATDCHVAGSLTGKAGLLHLHTGEGQRRLSVIREAIEQFEVHPSWFYPTHVDRSEALLREAAELSRSGMPVDLDVFEQDLPRWLRLYRDAGGDLDLLTISSDAAINSPRSLLEQLRACVEQKILPLERGVAIATSNTARILRLEHKGAIREGSDADIVLLERDTLELKSVVARGRIVFDQDGSRLREPFLEKSNREIELRGDRAERKRK